MNKRNLKVERISLAFETVMLCVIIGMIRGECTYRTTYFIVNVPAEDIT